MKDIHMALADRLCKILTLVEAERCALRAAARRRQITLPQLVAAALTESLLGEFIVLPAQSSATHKRLQSRGGQS
jgi:hypothetical protein